MTTARICPFQGKKCVPNPEWQLCRQCSCCDKEYGSDFCKGCPNYVGEDAY